MASSANFGFRTATLLFVLLVSTTSIAHHSRAPFDMNRIVVFEGTVVRYQWRNPHVYLYVEDEEGREWTIETGATPIMQRSGWARDSFSSGDRLTLRVHPDKDSSKAHGVLDNVTTSDGTVFASMNRGDGKGIPIEDASTTNLAGVWSGERLKTGEFMRSLASHPLTENGRQARENFDDSMNPAADCIALPTPFIMVANGLYLTEVELGQDIVTIRNEFYDSERTVYMDGRGHPTNGERTTQGHSIGRWEGRTLVVDTTLFAEHRSPIPNFGVPSGPDKHVIERLTLADSGKTVLVEFVMEDPDYLAAPIVAEYTWHYAPHLEMFKVECERGIARKYLE